MIVRPRGSRVHVATIAAMALACAVSAPRLDGARLRSLQPNAVDPSGIVLNGQIDLARLVDLAAKQAGTSIEYDAAQLKQASVTLRSSSPLDTLALWALANKSLQQRGMTTIVPAGSSGLMVVKLEDAAKLSRLEGPIALKTLTAEGPWTPLAGYRNLLVEFEFISPKDAADVLKGVAGRGGSSADSNLVPMAGGARVLLLSDQSSRIDEVLRFLVRMDVPSRATVTTEIPVRNLTSSQVVTAAGQIATKREAVGNEKLSGEIFAAASGNGVLVVCPRGLIDTWTEIVRQADQRDPVETVPYTPRVFSVRDVASLVQQIASAGEAPDERFRAIVEEPTGTLIVTATAVQHAKIRELMDRLDSVPSEARRPMRAFVVRNRPVSELLAVLQQMIAAGVLDAAPDDHIDPGTNGLSPAQLPTGAMSTVSGAAGGPPAADFGPNTTATARRTGRSSGGATLAVSLSADEATNTIVAIGDGRVLTQIEALLKALDVRQPQVMLEVVLVTLSDRDSLSLGVELQQIFRDGDTTSTLSSLFGLSQAAGSGAGAILNPAAATGFTGAVINPGDFAIIIRAIQSLGEGRAVSLPKVLVANNQRSEFNALLQEPYGVSFTQGNSTTTNVTFGGTLDAGTKVIVKPQISESDAVLLDYTISISAFAEKGRVGNLPPTRQVNSLQSLATVPDSHTVVVGGLETTSDSQTTDQIPWIGSIPVLGELFKNQSKSRSRSRFFVFIRATVMRNHSFEALRHVTAPSLEQAGLTTEWPTSEPQLIK